MLTVPTIFVIAGVLLVIVAVIGGGLEIKELKVPPLPPTGRVLSAIAGVAFTLLGLFWRTDGPPPRPPQRVQVVIDRPLEGAEVPSNVVVTGRVTPPPGDAAGFYWLVLRDEGGDSYPHGRIGLQQDGRWEEPVTFGRAWSGKSAWIVVGHASESVDAELQQARQSGEAALPSGMRTIATRRVRVQAQ